MAPRDYGRYTLLKKLAMGGMAEVFLARQKGMEGFEKLLVIKRILPHLAGDEEFVMMFLNEARIAARFNHPNVVQIYDLGKEGDTFFIAMEYIHGEDLGRIMRKAWEAKSWIPIPITLRIMAAVCEGLYYAHAKTDDRGQPLRVVHRDISPQNVIVSFDGNVKLVDFGIARASDQASTTRAGAIKGKYSYMAPEQASGKPLDHRTDIFAAGLVLYELLTGSRPLKRDSDILTLKAAVECDIRPPSQVVQLPPDIDMLVMKALARVADDRYQDARAFEMAIESYLASHQWAATTIHVSEFMKQLFANRLDEELRRGGEPVLGVDSASGVPMAPQFSNPDAFPMPHLSGSPSALSASALIPANSMPAELPPPLPSRQAAESTAPPSLPDVTPARGTNLGQPTEVVEEWYAPPGAQGAADPAPRAVRRSRQDLRIAREIADAPTDSHRVDEAFPNPGKRTSRSVNRPRPQEAAPVDAGFEDPAPPRRPSRELARRRTGEVSPPSEPPQPKRRRTRLYVEAEDAQNDEVRAPSRAERTEEDEVPDSFLRRWAPQWVVIALLLVGAAAYYLVPSVRERAFSVVRGLQTSAPGSDSPNAVPEAEPARLTLESNVPVEVYLGDKKIGTTPVRAKPVPSGDLELRLLNLNYGIDKTLALNAEPGGELKLKEKIVLGKVRFRSDTECDVSIRGRKAGRAPGPPLEYAEGSYDATCSDGQTGRVAKARFTVPKEPGRATDVVFRF